MIAEKLSTALNL